MTNENKVTEERSVITERGDENRLSTFKATQLIWLIFGILEGLLALRIILKLIAANPYTPIVRLIYGITAIFLWPFQNITISPSAGNVVLEIPTIIALLVYALIGWAIERLIWVIFYRPRQPVEEITERKTTDEHKP